MGAVAAPRHRDRPRVHARRAHARSTVASLCQAAPGRFALGIGTSSNVIVERWNGIPFDKPYQRVRDTIRFLRAALTGEKVDEEYETFAVRGFRLGITVPEQPPILVAALRGHVAARGPRRRRRDHQLAVGRRREDGRAARRRGQGDRRRGIFVFPTDDRGLARAVGKRAIASYLTVPVYAAFHEWLGRGESCKDMWRLWKAGDRKAAAEAIPDEVVDDLLVWGTPEQCKEHIDRYIANGVTTPAPASFCGPDQLRDVRRPRPLHARAAAFRRPPRPHEAAEALRRS